jgi:ATP synthase protein I
LEVVLAEGDGPNQTGPGRTGDASRRGSGPDEGLERRKRDLEAALAKRRPETHPEPGSKSAGMTGFGNALRLSSEFIAGIAVGAGIGWFFDRYLGTSPFGLIVFLLLGFVAGVLNVLRSAGLVAEPGTGRGPDKGERPDQN